MRLASVREEEPTGRRPLRRGAHSSPGLPIELKAEFLSQVGRWAAQAAPPLGALFGCRLAQICESSEIAIPAKLTCQRCESILVPGLNCRLVGQRKLYFSCNYCRYRTSKSVKTKAEQIDRTPVRSLSPKAEQQSTGKKRRRKSWSSLKELAAAGKMSTPSPLRVSTPSPLKSFRSGEDQVSGETFSGVSRGSQEQVNFKLPSLRKVANLVSSPVAARTEVGDNVIEISDGEEESKQAAQIVTIDDKSAMKVDVENEKVPEAAVGNETVGDGKTDKVAELVKVAQVVETVDTLEVPVMTDTGEAVAETAVATEKTEIVIATEKAEAREKAETAEVAETAVATVTVIATEKAMTVEGVETAMEADTMIVSEKAETVEVVETAVETETVIATEKAEVLLNDGMDLAMDGKAVEAGAEKRGEDETDAVDMNSLMRKKNESGEKGCAEMDDSVMKDAEKMDVEMEKVADSKMYNAAEKGAEVEMDDRMQDPQKSLDETLNLEVRNVVDKDAGATPLPRESPVEMDTEIPRSVEVEQETETRTTLVATANDEMQEKQMSVDTVMATERNWPDPAEPEHPPEAPDEKPDEERVGSHSDEMTPRKVRQIVRSFLSAKRLQSARYETALRAVKRQFKKEERRKLLRLRDLAQLEKQRADALTVKLQQSAHNFFRSKRVAMAASQTQIAFLRRQLSFLPALRRRITNLSGEMAQICKELRKVVHALDEAKNQTFAAAPALPPEGVRLAEQATTSRQGREAFMESEESESESEREESEESEREESEESEESEDEDEDLPSAEVELEEEEEDSSEEEQREGEARGADTALGLSKMSRMIQKKQRPRRLRYEGSLKWPLQTGAVYSKIGRRWKVRLPSAHEVYP